MTCVKCSVNNCSYNKDGGCYVEKIQVGGKSSTEEDCTCCGTFLNQEHYSNLAEYTSSRSEAEEVGCNVETCKHNGNCQCTLDEIEVCGCNHTGNYTETKCASFELE